MPWKWAGSQAFGDRCRNLRCAAPVGRRALKTTAQGLAFQQFGYGVAKTAVFAEIINAEQVGMRQRRNNTSFAMKAGQSLRVGDRLLR
jgi:hypothetical protein